MLSIQLGVELALGHPISDHIEQVPIQLVALSDDPAPSIIREEIGPAVSRAPGTATQSGVLLPL
jgi:hypothetical protein